MTEQANDAVPLESKAPSNTRWLLLGAWGLTLAPVPLYLLWLVLTTPAPAWVATFTNGEHPAVTQRERQLNFLWTKKYSTGPGGLPIQGMSATFDACVYAERELEIPIQLVANGTAKLRIDEQTALEIVPGPGRQARGAELKLEAGMHHFHVEYSSKGYPAIALNASLDGNAPQALGSRRVQGVSLSAPTGNPLRCVER